MRIHLPQKLRYHRSSRLLKFLHRFCTHEYKHYSVAVSIYLSAYGGYRRFTNHGRQLFISQQTGSRTIQRRLAMLNCICIKALTVDMVPCDNLENMSLVCESRIRNLDRLVDFNLKGCRNALETENTKGYSKSCGQSNRRLFLSDFTGAPGSTN